MYVFVHEMRGGEQSNGEVQNKSEGRFDANNVSEMPPFDVQQHLQRTWQVVKRNVNEVICKLIESYNVDS